MFNTASLYFVSRNVHTSPLTAINVDYGDDDVCVMFSFSFFLLYCKYMQCFFLCQSFAQIFVLVRPSLLLAYAECLLSQTATYFEPVFTKLFMTIQIQHNQHSNLERCFF